MKKYLHNDTYIVLAYFYIFMLKTHIWCLFYREGERHIRMSFISLKISQIEGPQLFGYYTYYLEYNTWFELATFIWPSWAFSLYTDCETQPIWNVIKMQKCIFQIFYRFETLHQLFWKLLKILLKDSLIENLLKLSRRNILNYQKHAIVCAN